MGAGRLCLAVIVAALVVCCSADSVVIKTKQGVVEGYKSFLFHKHRIWKGIPFGAPPVGDLRFEPPQTAPSWEGVKETKDFGHDCLQVDGHKSLADDNSEDCLYLNVWAPDDLTEALPVMVFFYGGSWSYGGSSFALYDGEKILKEVNDVIIVTANYRLGGLGFMASSELSQTSKYSKMQTSGNYGLLDQRKALEWVQENIAAFGGNTSKVSMWGESAGAGSVTNHMVMPGSNGLFSRTIAESGPAAMWVAKPFEMVQQGYNFALQQFGCNGTAAEQRACLQKVNASAVMHLHTQDSEIAWCQKTPCCSKFGDSIQYLEWAPVIDGKELPDHPMVLVREGKINSGIKHALLGTNLNEGTLFVPHLDHSANETQYQTWISTMFKSLAPFVRKTYPSSNYKSPWWAAARTITDSFMACPARTTAKMLTDVGVTTYLYQFTHEWDETDVDPYLGVFHGSELPFVFNVGEGFVQLPDGWYIPVLLSPRELTLSHRMVKYWTCFATNGDPSSCNSGDVEWPLFNATSDYNLEIGLTIAPMQNLKKQSCDYFENALVYDCPVNAQ